MKKTAIIVAHPDDEILWLSSKFEEADIIISCFKDFPKFKKKKKNKTIGQRRSDFFKEQPYSKFISLNIDEIGTFDCVDWNNPELCQTGIVVADIQEEYDKTYHLTKKKLIPLLENIQVAYTHNPWGEYGHPDHILVHKVVLDIMNVSKKQTCWTGYVSQKSTKLAEKILAANKIEQVEKCHTNAEVIKPLLRLYKKHRIWTWYDNYRWPRDEIFLSYSHREIDTQIKLIQIVKPKPWTGIIPQI